MYKLLNIIIMIVGVRGFNVINPIVASTSLVSSYGLIKGLDNINNVNITRKVVHIVTGPSFISTWNLYKGDDGIFWAALVPVLGSIYMVSRSDKMASVLSRSGDSGEIMEGPLMYTFMLTIITLLFWRNPAGIMGITQLAIGDGLADLIGRSMGRVRWIHNSNKSVEGTIGFVIGSFLCSLLLFKGIHMGSDIIRLFIISLVCGLVETVPFMEDNFWVPVTGVLGYDILFP